MWLVDVDGEDRTTTFRRRGGGRRCREFVQKEQRALCMV